MHRGLYTLKADQSTREAVLQFWRYRSSGSQNWQSILNQYLCSTWIGKECRWYQKGTVDDIVKGQ